MAYADTDTVHVPATGAVAPAAWGTQVRDNLEFLVEPPACSVSNSTAEPTASGVSEVLAANSESYDTDAMHSTVTNNSRITAQTAAKYLVSATVLFASNATGGRNVSFLVNGTTVLESTLVQAANGNSTVITSTRTVSLGAGDYIECRVLQNSGGALNATLHEFLVLWQSR